MLAGLLAHRLLQLLEGAHLDLADTLAADIVVGRKVFKPSGDDRTSILCSALHTDSPGALYRLLEPFAKHKISMTRIESRPSRRRKWDYLFFIDVMGHAEEPPLSIAIQQLKEQSSLFRVLGSYPAAVL